MNRVYAMAEATSYLAGRRVRRLNPSAFALLLIVVFGTALVAAVVSSAGGRPAFVFVPLLFLFGPTLSLRHRAAIGVRLNNDGVQRLQRDDVDGAVQRFRAVVTGYHVRDTVVMALHNLGVVALRQRDVEAAAALFRASIEASRGFRFRSTPDYYQNLARSQLAFTLAVLGDPEGAEVELSAMRTLPSAALAIAHAVRARAMIAARRERWEEVVRILDEENDLLRNVLVASEAVLAEALEAYALSRLGESAPRPSVPVLADVESRAYVRRVLPEAESILADA